MLWPGKGCRLPQLAGQRVRLASVTAKLVDGIPWACGT